MPTAGKFIQIFTIMVHAHLLNKVVVFGVRNIVHAAAQQKSDVVTKQFRVRPATLRPTPAQQRAEPHPEVSNSLFSFCYRSWCGWRLSSVLVRSAILFALSSCSAISNITGTHLPSVRLSCAAADLPRYV